MHAFKLSNQCSPDAPSDSRNVNGHAGFAPIRDIACRGHCERTALALRDIGADADQVATDNVFFALKI